MKQLFFSDVHLGAQPNHLNDLLTDKLLRIIDYCEVNRIKIHILGDLMDYWMEYPDYTPNLGDKILDRFKTFHQTIEPGFFITGNHDNWTSGYFSEIGFRVEHESVELNLEGLNVLMLHGDGLKDPKMNLPRPLFHQVLRNPRFITLYQALFSGYTGNHLMKTFSEFTRNSNYLEIEKLNNWAQNLLNQKSFDYILAGHDHVARVETYSGGIYINTGAFYSQYTAAMYNNNTIDLVIWNDEQSFFEPYRSPLKVRQKDE